MPGVLVGGLAALLIGLIMLFAWLEAVLILVKALAALGFIGGGAIAVYLGWEEFRDIKKASLEFSSPAEANRYQAEAEAYQAELAEISQHTPDQPVSGPEAQSAGPDNKPEN